MSVSPAFARAVSVSTATTSRTWATLAAAVLSAPERAPFVALTLTREADRDGAPQAVTLYLHPEDLPGLRDVLADAVAAFAGAHEGERSRDRGA